MRYRDVLLTVLYLELLVNLQILATVLFTVIFLELHLNLQGFSRMSRKNKTAPKNVYCSTARSQAMMLNLSTVSHSFFIPFQGYPSVFM